MRKGLSFILSLLLGICFLGGTAVGAEEQVDLWIHTWSEKGEKVEGTEKLAFDVYNLTQWREERKGDEKQDKEYLMNTYPSKEELKSFVEQEQLTKLNEASYLVDGSGNVSFDVPRYQDGKDAAYLILASGEEGEYHMLPIILYFPQQHPETGEEAQRLLIYGKYQDIKVPAPPEDPAPPLEPEEPSAAKDFPTLGKRYPSTNDLVRDFSRIGLVLVMIGFIGLKQIKKRK
ncbi:hypothetical protein ACFFH2_07770 [Enterococcus devriesei]|uniref:hypothetical protein n=1 Tax=Enterococcus devriesei TaxID=319970 RepID=UPI0008FFEBA0|nr:hypothetical protein [Enterococcus devriesei]